MSEQQGPGRRLSDEEEQRGAELFAAGKTEREVAEALGCSASTAHRLRERLQPADGSGLPPGSVIRMRLLPGAQVEIVDPAEGLAEEIEDSMRGARLGELVAARDIAAGVVADIEARARASRDAIHALDAERLELLAAGRDAAPLRSRRADAEADLADAETAAGMARQRVAEAAALVAEAQAEIVAAAAEKARREAAERGGILAPRAARALRDAVSGDGTVRALAELGRQLARAEQVSGQSWEAVVVPPALPGHPRDDWHRAVYALWQAALAGDVAGCQRAVPHCLPWQDRTPEEIAGMAADVAANATRMQQLAHETAARLRASVRGGPSVLPELPNALPGAVRSARTGW